MFEAAVAPREADSSLPEKFLDDDRAGPASAQMQSLNMLVCTEGKKATLAEYERLLNRVGFRDVQGCRTCSPLDAVLGLKPGRPAIAGQTDLLKTTSVPFLRFQWLFGSRPRATQRRAGDGRLPVIALAVHAALLCSLTLRPAAFGCNSRPSP